MNQQRLIEINDPVPKRSWFEDALNSLEVHEGSGWPDKFGVAINKYLSRDGYDQIPILSLFTGAGGLDIGFHNSGFHSKEMIEIEERFVKTLRENTEKGGVFQDSKLRCIDIREYVPKKELKVDFIIGGPPCQTFSAAGRRASGVLGTDDPRGMLFAEYVRLIKHFKPKGFLFENVYGIVGAQNGKPWLSIQQSFMEAGYRLHYKILDAADYGVPQHRERLIIVGLKDGEFLFPYPTHGPDSTDGRPFYTAGNAVKEVEIQPNEIKYVNGRYGHLLNDIPRGLNYSFYTKKLGHPHPVFSWRSKFSDFLYKADPNKPVRAIKAQGGQYTGPFSWENRAFTIDELKRLQTMPDDFRLVGGRQVAIHQIGNSVPTQLARILSLAILDQVFHVPLPFKIEYMEHGFKLNFRKRKAQSSKEYLEKAQKAIRNIVVVTNSKTCRQEEILKRYLSYSFDLTDKPKSGYKKGTFLVQRGENLKISLTSKEPASFKLSITPKLMIGWDLPYKQLVIESSNSSAHSITFLWKVLEEVLRNETKIADLVQFSGYYQYSSAIKTLFSIEQELYEKHDIWRMIKFVSELSGAYQANSKTIAEASKIDVSEIYNVFREMRSLGYEVRNTRTNSQIPVGEYLIPYSFPTLNPMSVQLRKKL